MLLTLTTDDYDYHDRRREHDSPEQVIKNIIIKLGEVVSPSPLVTSPPPHQANQDPSQEVPRVAKQIREAPVTVAAISEGIRLA